MKTLLTCLFSFIIFLASAQIKLNPDYSYTYQGKGISYNKGLKLLQSGNYIADINDGLQTVTIKEAPNLAEGDQFPFEEMTDVNGTSISPASLQGKVVVINFWFTGCRPCNMEIPELNELVKNYDGQQVVFLAFANDIRPVVSRFLDKKAFDYRQIPDQMTKTLNKGITEFPTHYIVNKEGEIVTKITGYSEGIGQKLAAKIDKLLQQ